MGIDVGETNPVNGTGSGSAASFDEFARGHGPDLRRVLVARFGLEVGVEATADALAYAWERWDRVGPMANPTGYLVRVGQSAAGQRRRDNFPAATGGGPS